MASAAFIMLSPSPSAFLSRASIPRQGLDPLNALQIHSAASATPNELRVPRKPRSASAVHERPHQGRYGLVWVRSRVPGESVLGLVERQPLLRSAQPFKVVSPLGPRGRVSPPLDFARHGVQSDPICLEPNGQHLLERGWQGDKSCIVANGGADGQKHQEDATRDALLHGQPATLTTLQCAVARALSSSLRATALEIFCQLPPPQG